MSPHPEAANGSHVRNVRAALVRVWSPKGLAEHVARDWPGHATGEAAVLYWRVRLLTLPLGLVGSAIVAASLIAWFAGYRTTIATVVFAVGGAISMATITVLHAFRLWMLFKIGGWSRRKGGSVRRFEQPAKFWLWAAASSSILVALVCLAGLVLWTLISALSGRAA